ncbi:MAG: DUF2336 domain-containing protein [Alphaproteobacteria bacterium]
MTEAELAHLLDLARDRSVKARQELVETVSGLFFNSTQSISEQERALMTDILRRLIHDVEMSVRKKLAQHLADKPNAPHDLIVTLANDEIEVAHPILASSTVLHDMELIEVIRVKTCEHQLAIAMRRQVSESVSSALIETGNVNVIGRLLENPNAEISQAAMAYLVEQSRQVDAYQKPLLDRQDLGPELASRMYWWVSAALRKHILTNFDIDADDLDETIENTVRGSLSDTFTDPATQALAGIKRVEKPAAGSELAQHLANAKAITPKLLIQTLRQGEIHLFEALFSKLGDIPIRLVQRMMFESDGEALAVACRAFGIFKADFASIFLLSRKARPGDKIVDPNELSRALDIFDRTDNALASKIVRRWQRDPKYLDAVADVAVQPELRKAAQ